MITSLSERSLEERLQPRLAVEERFAKTGRKYRSKSFLFRYDRYWLHPLLKLGLHATGLYSRGVDNALNPVIRPLTLEFPNLPRAFDGFQILHISDLHIDGVDGL